MKTNMLRDSSMSPVGLLTATRNIIDVANIFNIDAKIIGSCKSSKSKKLTIISQYGTFEY